MMGSYRNLFKEILNSTNILRNVGISILIFLPPARWCTSQTKYKVQCKRLLSQTTFEQLVKHLRIQRMRLHEVSKCQMTQCRLIFINLCSPHLLFLDGRSQGCQPCLQSGRSTPGAIGTFDGGKAKMP